MSSEPTPDDPEETATYEVGYAKPPKATRFQPGRSGNPKGRPKGGRKKRPADAVTERLTALMLEEAHRPIQVRDGDGLVEMSTSQAALRSLSLNAIKGNQRAQRMFFDMVRTMEREKRQERLALFEAALDYKQQKEEEIAQARNRGLPEPVFIPHPHHIIIDPRIGSVKIRGPLTDEEKVYLDWMHAFRAQLEEEVAELESELRAGSREEGLTDRIATRHRKLARVNDILEGHEHVILSNV